MHHRLASIPATPRARTVLAAAAALALLPAPSIADAARARDGSAARTALSAPQRIARAARVAGIPIPAPYGGPTGAVLHVRTRSAVAEDAGRAPFATETDDRWAELGGGLRSRDLVHSVPLHRGGLDHEVTWETWSSPQLAFSGPAGPLQAWQVGHAGQLPHVALRCPGAAALMANEATQEIATMRAAQAAAGAAPAGPTVDGRSTVVVAMPAQGSAAAEHLVLDAITRAPLEQITVDAKGAPHVLRILTWEVVPAGGSAAQLTGALPANVVVDTPTECGATPALTAAPSH